MNTLSTLPRGFLFEEITADIVVHSFGPLLEDAFIESAHGLFETMSPGSSTKTVARAQCVNIEVSAPSQEMLLFQFLNELLGNVWGEKKLLVGAVEIDSLSKNIEFVEEEVAVVEAEVDAEKKLDDAAADADGTTTKQRTVTKRVPQTHWNLRARAFGEPWDSERHEVGTEVKAITMHGLAVELREEDMLYHTFCVIDV